MTGDEKALAVEPFEDKLVHKAVERLMDPTPSEPPCWAKAGC
ncbi:hypothetical protein ABT187_33620 [Streptomyces sp. NPDC001817]